MVAFYRRWRPQTFDEVVGQEHVTHTLRNAIATGRIAHAYLFAGPRGTGKTTMARLLAKGVNCLHPDAAARPCNACAMCSAVAEGRLLDLIEIDAASHRGIDDIRELRDKIHFAPAEARYKVYVVDECHMLTNEAFNALLKTLEEPPPHALFVLATTDPQKMPATVLSRCQRYDFRRLTLKEIVARLEQLARAEGLAVEAGVLEMVARQATGALRDAESLLDQLAAYSGTITLEQAQAVLGVGTPAHVSAIVDGLIRGDTAGGLDIINQAVNAGADVRQLARQIVEHLRAILLAQMGSAHLLDASGEQRQALEAQAQQLPTPALIKAIKAFSQAASDLRTSWQPQLWLELAYVEAVLPASPPPVPAAGAGAPHPASPPQPVASPPAPQPGQATLSLAAVQAQWGKIMAALHKSNIPAKALLDRAQLIAVEGQALVLSWPSEPLRQRYLEDPRKRQLFEEIAGEILGQPVSTHCVVGQAAGQHDPLVEDAIQSLGAVVSKP